ncbi:hypothetical protein HMPREF1624_08417 [Sporothrix schenckii ATCC 58251]|uniref:Methyltransferase type 11 domain-containing protein n=1 Tax=Sporothrix schenckii (strain ATCC 58251 / de Perez 2211183) TaxID=1391915 RepID=U7PJU7_SPOS1|nr:hypothetical protein HMPREF1624_08417 [Sporothrix schenckii ATCC 58251]
MDDPHNDEVLSHAEFWDGRYSVAVKEGAEATTESTKTAPTDEPTHEWFRSYSDLEPFLVKVLFGRPKCGPADNPSVLHLGCGDSVIPAELETRGYRNQLCVDFSSTVIQLMTARYAGRSMRWQQMDVRHMADVPSASVQVCFDKGTLDAMIHGSPWSPPDDVLDNTGRYLREVYRVLADEGVFVYVTFRQPHFIRPLFDKSLQSDDGRAWNMELEILGDTEGTFNYYGWVITKGKSSQ